MSWGLILLLAAIVFCNRYVFLEPRVPVKLPALLEQALQYAAPCLLTAICGPIILLDQGAVRPFPDNPYLWGALASVVLACLVRNMVLSVLASLAAFYALCAWL
ncbi:MULTISPECIES: AzlD domain-containing protein [Chromobacteriaceae]|uniref:AzlD domain-containing protein n=2 Tax=Chromobacteriaceae TaxID=1499392 RepID=A0ABV0CH37_9NEIS|nr:AzlD domain-containing protein [Pseudogulbenkiania ferrooxidans]ERE03824.1 branched-chain amino acid transport [Pseudogulbenkiania ferrooxidans EGD-HP2]